MTAMFITFDASVVVQSVLHIGDGTRLVHEMDFVLEDNETSARIIDVEKALDIIDDAELAKLKDGNIARALGERRREQCTRDRVKVYRSSDIPSPKEVLAFIRGADGRPYIPGSSLKGAIRTAIVRRLASRESISRLLERGEAKRVEAEVLDKLSWSDRVAEPQNRDLMRAIRVSDFRASNVTKVAFLPVFLHRVGEDNKRLLTMWAECVLRASEFRGTISVDRALLNSSMGADSRVHAPHVERFEELLRADTKAVLEEARKWAGAVFDAWVEPAGSATLLLLGWGTGWLAHTLGPRLTMAERRQLADRLGLGRRQRGVGHPFPLSYRCVRLPAELFEAGRPGTIPVPMGVVALELKERR